MLNEKRSYGIPEEFEDIFTEVHDACVALEDEYFQKYAQQVPDDIMLDYVICRAIASANKSHKKNIQVRKDIKNGKYNYRPINENMKKQTIKLNESQFREIIKESIKMALKENMEPKPPFFWSISELRDTGNGFESYRCVEDSATSDDAVQDKFDTPEDAYQDGLKNLKYYNEGDYELEVYYFTPNGAGDYVSGYMAEIHNGSITEY